MGGLGLIFGNLVGSIGDLIANNPAMAQILASGAASQADLSFAFVMSILAITTSVLGVQIVLRLHFEESQQRVSPLLAGSLRRQTLLASTVVVALAGTALGLLAAGLGLGLVAASKNAQIAVTDVVAQAAATIPAVWVLVCLAVAALGAAPSRILVAWAGVVATFALTLLGPTFKLPEWALDVSPLRHVADVTAVSPQWSGAFALGAIALAFLAVGFVGYRRRDIA